MSQELHSFIVRRECQNNGWQTGRWKAGLAKAAKSDPRFAGEFTESEGNGDEIWGGLPVFTPDAWRIVVEGPETESKDWGGPVMVLELLEVEITHPIPFDKHRYYVRLWWRFDGTSCFHLRIYRIGRYGPATLWLDTTTAQRIYRYNPLTPARRARRVAKREEWQCESVMMSKPHSTCGVGCWENFTQNCSVSTDISITLYCTTTRTKH